MTEIKAIWIDLTLFTCATKDIPVKLKNVQALVHMPSKETDKQNLPFISIN